MAANSNIEWNLGRLSGRQLTLRWYAPWKFRQWTDSGYRLSLTRLVNPLHWFATIFRGEYDFDWTYHPNNNHRCYCAVGTLFDGRLCIAGWGVTWFYSHFTGEVPCACDRVMAELFPEEQE